ncbi:MAG: hypothetical protein AABY84_04640, partial [Candidatus Firestonebacteria bacterium]
FLVFLFPFNSFSWDNATHRLIVNSAITSKLLQKDLQKILDENKSELLSGVIASDKEDIYKFHDEQICKINIKEIMEKLLTKTDSKEIAYELGRISGYISDMNEPLKLEKVEGEQFYTVVKYEIGVAKQNFEITGLSAPVYIASLDDYFSQVSLRTGKYYDEIIGSVDNIEVVKDTTRELIVNSINDTLSIWWTAYENILLNELESTVVFSDDFINVSDKYLSLGQKEKARQFLITGIRRNPESVILYKKLGRFYVKNDLSGFAVDVYLAWLERKPDDFEICRELALAYESMQESAPLTFGKYEKKAIEQWEKLLNTAYDDEAKTHLKALGE